MPNPPSVCVITGTTGNPKLKKCIESVQEQSYALIDHLVVVDGPEWNEKVDVILGGLEDQRGVKLIRLPHPTGKNYWNAHRIYGAMPSIAMSDFVCWLDDDNWFEPEHIESLVASVTASQAAWSFSFRNIVDADGNFIARDECECLGNLHPTFQNPNDFHIDANCYLLRRDVAIQLSGVWNRPGFVANELDPDKLLCRVLMEHFPNGQGTRKYTVNYTVGTTPRSVKADFFLNGNGVMKARYPQGLPWETAIA